jgi:hypothetical protein
MMRPFRIFNPLIELSCQKSNLSLIYNRGGVPSNQKLGDIIVNGRGNKYVYILYRIYRRLALLFVFVFVCLFVLLYSDVGASFHPSIYICIYFETSILYIIKEG